MAAPKSGAHFQSRCVVKVYSKIDYGACRLCQAFLGGMSCHVGFVIICSVILGIHLRLRIHISRTKALLRMAWLEEHSSGRVNP